MDLNSSLFQGRLVFLDSINPGRDAEIESRWSHDAEFQHMLGNEFVKPLSSAQIKKNYAEMEKEMDEKGTQIYFAIRRLPDEVRVESSRQALPEVDNLLGFAKLEWIVWTHAVGSISLGIGSPEDRGKGYGSDALRLILGYAFRELNFFRVGASLPGYNQVAIRLLEKASFQIEARRREVLLWEQKRWDMLYMGLLREEWQQSEWCLGSFASEKGEIDA